MKIVIIENEARVRSMLRSLIEQSGQEVEIVGEADSVEAGLELINTVQPEAILLDVELGDGSGFDLLSQLDEVRPQVVFVTAFGHYALQAFRADAVDYLEKPVDVSQLSKALQKLQKHIATNQVPVYPQVSPAVLKSIKERIAVPTRYGNLYVNTSEILYVKADGAYAEVYMENATTPHVISRRLQQVEDVLHHLGFVRVHRSFIVNVAKVVELSKTDGGFVMLQNGQRISFSRHYKDKAFHTIKALTTSL